ncbi:MAG: sensor histidine kinase, partial [Campylobacterales bacterium]|nr:sensor histidine kinase [Campylobacterales bacterium]
MIDYYQVRLLAIWLILSTLSFAKTIINSDRVDSFSIEYHIVENTPHTIETVQNAAFIPTTNYFSLGYHKNGVWLKLTLTNRLDTKQFILELSEAYYYQVDFYFYHDNEWQIQRSGLSQYIQDHKLKHIRTKFAFGLESNTTQSFYLYLKARPDIADMYFGKLTLSTQDSYIGSSTLSDHLLYALYFGTLFYIAIFNLFLFATIKQRIYLYYTGYVVTNALFLFSYSSLPYYFGLVEYRDTLALAVPWMTIMFALFSMEYLNTRSYLPRVDKLLRYALAFLALISPIVAIDFYPWFDIIVLLITLFVPLIIYAGVYIYLKGYIESKLYLAILLLYILSMVVVSLIGRGWIDNSDINHYAFIYISFIEIVIFSFVLANRFTKILQEQISHLQLMHQKDRVIHQQNKMASIGAMITSIAHQWKQPITSLNSTIGILKLLQKSDKITPQKLNNKLEDMERNIEHMEQTIRDFLTYSTPDKSKSSFKLSDTMQRALMITEAQRKRDRVKIHTHCDSEITLHSYEGELIQVIVTLLTNAFEVLQGQSKREVHIHTTQADNTTIINVEDSGGGIHPDLLERLFEPYFSTKEKGTGLGLYITKMIVEESLGGKIAVANGNNGAKFT